MRRSRPALISYSDSIGKQGILTLVSIRPRLKPRLDRVGACSWLLWARRAERAVRVCQQGAGNKWRWSQSNNYWSATTYQNNPSNAWNVNFNDGNVNANNKSNNNYVRGVRGGS